MDLVILCPSLHQGCASGAGRDQGDSLPLTPGHHLVSDRLPQPALQSCDRGAQNEGVSTESRSLMALLQKGA